jgi:hypothetical protein
VEAGLDAPQLAKEWKVFLGADAGGWVVQPTVATINHTEAELQAIVDAAAAIRTAAVAAPGFTLAGATGGNAAIVNGTFVKLDEQQNGKSVYGQVGNPTRCCWYNPNKTWMVSYTTKKDANEDAGCAFAVEVGLDAPQLAKEWTVWLGADAGGWAVQPTVTTTKKTAVELNAAGADASHLLAIADQHTAALVAHQLATSRAQPQTQVYPARQVDAQLTAQKMQTALVRVGGGGGGGVAAAPVITVVNFEEGKYLCTYTVPPNSVGAWALEVLVHGKHVPGSPFAVNIVDHESQEL